MTVTLSDYTFTFSAPLTVENSGPQLHEVTIEQLVTGKTLADVQRWMAAGMKGEPPTRPVGGFIGPDVGKTGWFTVTLQPGKYLLTCTSPTRRTASRTWHTE